MLEAGSVRVREAIPRGTDPGSGATVKQMTSDIAIHTQIYGEVPYTDAESRYFIFTRQRSTHGLMEVWRADLQTDALTPVCGEVVGISGMAVSTDQRYFYCVRHIGDRQFRIVRTGIEQMEQLGWTFTGAPYVRSLGTVGPDGRTYVTSTMLSPRKFGVVRYDLVTSRREVIHEGPEICNAHPQIEPGNGELILIQHNRGSQVDEQGNVTRSVGEAGATLYLIGADGGGYQELPVGEPHTYPVQGHQCWVGDTGEILLTIGGPRDDMITQGNLLRVKPGDAAARVVAKGHFFWHPSASKCGRFFVSDTGDEALIVVGSLETGRTAVLCPSGASRGAPQYTHPHPYFTPDCRHVIFNSDRTGIAQIYVATLPEGLLESLVGPAE